MKVGLITGRAGDEPALDLTLPQALLARVAAGARGPVLRVYRPQPTVAFGRRDVFLPGFDRAADAARRWEFAPLVRGAGGRAAAYDEGCLVFDEIMPAHDAMSGIRERFSEEAERQAQALRGLGVDARVGAVPGEYCPGEFSVNARGEIKLIGAGQRIIRGGWMFSTVVVVTSASRLRGVLTDVYAALQLAWEPRSVGSVAGEAPGVGLDEVESALLESYAQRFDLVRDAVTGEELAAAAELAGQGHRACPR